MFQTSAKIDPRDIRFLQRMGFRYPKALMRAWKGTTARVINKLKSVFRKGGGKEGVPAFTPRSELFRSRLNQPWGGKLGGPSLRALLIRKHSRDGGTCIIGFNPAILAGSKFGEAFQTSEIRPWTKRQRRMLYRWNRKAEAFIGKIRPMRPLFDPFAQNITTFVAAETLIRARAAWRKERNR